MTMKYLQGPRETLGSRGGQFEYHCSRTKCWEYPDRNKMKRDKQKSLFEQFHSLHSVHITVEVIILQG